MELNSAIINWNFYAIGFTEYNKEGGNRFIKRRWTYSSQTGQNTDKIRQKIIHVFKDNGFSIDIVTNLVEVNFLGVAFNLRNGSYQPCKMPDDELLRQCLVLSNHPPQILKQLTTTISDRLSRNSSS